MPYNDHHFQGLNQVDDLAFRILRVVVSEVSQTCDTSLHQKNSDIVCNNVP